MKRIDCFAYMGQHCRVLRGNDCEKCKFYKTEQQYDDDHNRCVERLQRKYGVSYDKVMEIKGYKHQ